VRSLRQDRRLSGLLQVAPDPAALALVVAAFLAVGCGGEGDVVSGPGAEPEPAPVAREPALVAREPALDDLAALGYADWDPGADASSGVVRIDPERARPGLTLFADEVDRAFALELDGTLAHAWTIPGRSQVEHVVPLGDGRIAAVSVDEGVTVVDRGSRVLWSADLNAHHDACVTADGALLVPEWVERDYRGRRVRFDRLVRVTADGARVVWDAFERLDELRALHPPLALDEPAGAEDASDAVYDYYHLNTVARVGAGAAATGLDVDPEDLVVCFRNANLIAVLDAETYDVRWSRRPGTLDMPHTPSFTDAGTLLVFDNGRHRGWSRVVEVAPATGETLWSFRATPREAFFSDVRGCAQRLANGNTLVTESERGRVFELDAAGEVVWEFLNPERRGDARKRIYRAMRYARDAVL